MGAISTYYERVNQEIQNFSGLRPLFHDCLEGVPSLKFIACQKIKDLDSQKISLNFLRLPTDCHENYLQLQTSFKDWKVAQLSCDSLVFNTEMKRLSNQLNLHSENPELAILTHFFKEMFQNSEVKNDIISLKRAAQPFDASFKNSFRESIEKIVQKTANFFSDPTVRRVGYSIVFAVSVIAGLVFLNALMGTAISFIEPFSPLAAEVIRNRGLILLGLFAAERMTKNYVPKLHEWVIHPLRDVLDYTLFFPSRIVAESIVKINAFVWTKLPVIALRLHALSSKWNDLRLGHEYCEARDLWINIFLKERTLNRFKMEYDFAVADLGYRKINNLSFLEAEKKVISTQQALAQIQLIK